MVQDYAKRPAEMKQTSEVPRWVFFVTGFAAGFFLAFLIYLWKFVPGDPEADKVANLPRAEDFVPPPKAEEMQWDFYEIFPKSEVPVVEEYGSDGEKVVVEEPYAYLLQAGSFRNPEDADKLRAELILLGLDVFAKKIEVDGKQWTRVLVGPLNSDLELNRAQDKLAEAEIESLALKVTR
ncbi:MAG: SPOR domain-containing protein [Pseudomonadales bacterium]|nr:SPOR domain-containing protein [Pseudomonadales bacterium]